MFTKVFLEITDVCNMACGFCPPTERPRKFMAETEFRFLLDRLAGTAGRLHFHVKGEPLLHPGLGNFLRIAGDLGFEVGLTTNGSLLGRVADTLLAAAALRRLSVSIHCRADGSDAEEYWESVSAFLDLHRRSPRFPVSLRLWNLHSGSLPAETAILWRRLRDRYPHVGEWGSPGSWPAGNRLDEKVFLNAAEEFVWPDPALPEGGPEGRCLGLRDQIGVLVDGTVVPCCLDGEGRLALGNLFRDDLATILDSPRTRAMRSGFARNVLVERLCRTCGFRRRFDAKDGPVPGGRVAAPS